MDELQSLALTAAFLAATVVAGLALSLVPNVELVTLTVFAAGVVLGPARGALVGGAGMVLYVLANAAVRGFPPSPPPLLLAQAGGMAVAGVAGGLWRTVWTAGAGRRRLALFALPVVGLVAAAAYQTAVNLVSAALWAGGEQPFWVFFWAGMAFGAVQVGINGLLFAVAGPPLVHTLRRAARTRGWWGALALCAALCLPPGARATQGPGAGMLPDTAAVSPGPAVAAPPDTLAAPGPRAAAPPDSAARRTRPALRPLSRREGPLWSDPRMSDADEATAASYLAARSDAGLDRSRVLSPLFYPTPEYWGLGWGRARLSYDGLPLNGPVHGLVEPPDVPQAWPGSWREGWTSTGARFDLGAPPRQVPRPVSQVSLSTGSWGRRTVEFLLHRNLGPVNLATNLSDLETGSDGTLQGNDATRFWVHLDSAPGRRPDWSVDWATGRRKVEAADGPDYRQESRRLQASLRGPTLGGATRVAVQWRRTALRVSGQEDVRFDGFTLQGDWAAPGGVGITVRADRDRRRGRLETRTLDGVRGIGSWSGTAGGFELGGEIALGHQEPFGTLVEGAAAVGRSFGPWSVRGGWSRTSGLPPVVDMLDRTAPEAGLEDYLEAVETADEAETAQGFRLDLGYSRGDFLVAAGGWVVRQTGYLRGSVPLWNDTPGSAFRPVFGARAEATVSGVHGRVDVPLAAGFRLAGSGRVHDRGLEDVPYLPEWVGRGAAHWRGRLFRDDLDLDLSVGGVVFGERKNPAGEVYPLNTVGYGRAVARVDNGELSFTLHNLANAAVESDFRRSDATVPFLVPGTNFVLALTLRLFD